MAYVHRYMDSNLPELSISVDIPSEILLFIRSCHCHCYKVSVPVGNCWVANRRYERLRPMFESTLIAVTAGL